MAGEKRSAVDTEELAHKKLAILLDIEGTTSSISFVQDTLFPYVREFLKKHVDEKWTDEEFRADLIKLKEQAKEDEERKVDGFIPIKEGIEDEVKESVVQNVLWQMNNDRKTDALKQLQGHIWKAAYKPIKGHVYDDVPKAFERWTSDGKKLFIYSSGSIDAQRLLFGNSVCGDLLKYISGYFDTKVGPKQETDSYKNILKKIGLESSDVMFLTDLTKEAEAAKRAGLSTIIVTRKGNMKLSEEEKESFKVIESFTELALQISNKRQKLENINNEMEIKDTSKIDVLSSIKSVDEPMDTSENTETIYNKIKNDISSELKSNSAVQENKVLKESKKDKEIIHEAILEDEKETDIKLEIEKLEKNMTEGEKSKNQLENIFENTEKKEIFKMEIVSLENKSSDVAKPSGNVEYKSEKIKKVAEKVFDAEMQIGESASTENILEKEKNYKTQRETVDSTLKQVSQTVAEKLSENILGNIAEEALNKTVKNIVQESIDVKKIQENLNLEENEAKTSEKKFIDDVKENGEANIFKSKENKVEESENKENVQSIKESIKLEKEPETDTEKIDESKEIKEVDKENQIENEKELDNKVKVEDDTTKQVDRKQLNGTKTNGKSTEVIDENIHSNGINKELEKTKENGDADESIKIKKAVADGAGEPDVVNPPIVTATS